MQQAASFFDFSRHPGHLYVLATLLPLASFVVLFLAGRRLGKIGGYVATAAIAGAFILSLVGLVLFLPHVFGHDHHDHSHGSAAGSKHEAEAQHSHSHEHHEKFAWKGAATWVRLSGVTSDLPAIDLQLGYYIDSLAVVMFAMITFIAMLIHVFSMGYMADELTDNYEDHQAHVTRRGRYSRFFMFLSLFCFSMLNLVLADNLFQVFLSWELVGICSYLLIGFYYERQSATNAANKAFITNRVGDAGFIIGLLIFWTYCGSFNMEELSNTIRCYPKTDGDGRELVLHGQIVTANRPADFDPASRFGRHRWQVCSAEERGEMVVLFPRGLPVDNRDPLIQQGKLHYDRAPAPGEVLYLEPMRHLDRAAIAAIDPDEDHEHPRYAGMPYWLLVAGGLGIFLGCVGKSAQFPLQVWLPDAMEGPTPVSALIHAATMVAAGVYLVGRAFTLFTPEVQLTIAYTGAATLFIAATVAIVQTDIKKVLAYSTVSQLGFMMLALGVGGWAAGLFHLITHAFFKALLFLGSGSVIHGCHHEQEMTRMGGLYAKMRVTALTMLVGVLAIAGAPLFSGWYSKDAILVGSLSFVALNPQHILLFLLPLATAGITAFYMFRLWFMTFAGPPRDDHVYEHAHESPWVMTGPLIVLAIFSVIVAWGPNPLNVQGSILETKLLHASQPESLEVDAWTKTVQRQVASNEFDRSLRNTFLERTRLGPHDIAGILALASAAIGACIAIAVYYLRWLDPEEAKARFAGLHRFLWHKWYFDEFYRWAVVRPSLVVAGWCRRFDAKIIDGLLHLLSRGTVRTAYADGRFDLGVVDGLVNVTGNVVFAVGRWLRVFQTGLIRNYVLFLAVAAIGLFTLVAYVFAMAG